MTSRTKAIRLNVSDIERLTDAARRANVSVSLFVTEAIEQALDHGLARGMRPLTPGGKVIAPRLDMELITETEAKADKLGVTFSAYARAALSGYLGGEPAVAASPPRRVANPLEAGPGWW